MYRFQQVLRSLTKIRKITMFFSSSAGRLNIGCLMMSTEEKVLVEIITQCIQSRKRRPTWKRMKFLELMPSILKLMKKLKCHIQLKPRLIVLSIRLIKGYLPLWSLRLIPCSRSPIKYGLLSTSMIKFKVKVIRPLTWFCFQEMQTKLRLLKKGLEI